MGKLAAPYRPRRPEETVLYRVVRRHLETFIEHAAETYDSPLPKYVRNELRAYLRCGIFEHGFSRARCDECNHDLLIAFSCKGRGLCPSCAGRRMSNTAAQVVDRIIPAVPVRQWVLSLPFDLRASAAFDARILTSIIRAFAGALSKRYRSWARGAGLGASEFGAITFVQRFGSSLNLNVHLHVVVVDGAFSRDDQKHVLFTPASPPTPTDLYAVVRDTRRRVEKALSRLDATTIRGPLAACARMALQRGDVRAISEVGNEAEMVVATSPERDGAAVDDMGFNLEASVRIDADDDFGREHLLRYCARPPLSLARLTELPGGKISYRIKKLRNRGSKVRIMTPLDLLARLAALIPPPRHPLVRFHGAFAPRSSWRRDVVPKPRDRTPKLTHAHSPTPHTPRVNSHNAPAAFAPRTEQLTPNVLSVRHWERLKSGALLATTARIDWATLMRRTFDTDVLECPRCDGRLRIIAIVDDETIARKILTDLHIPRARSPPRTHDPTLLFEDAPHLDAP